MAVFSRLVILLAIQDKNITGEMPLQPYMTDKIKKIFLQNISCNPTLDDFCRQCGMSRSALHRFCLKYFNRPPGKAFMHLKMKHAIEVMRKNPNIKIKELSSEFGFKNAFHFSRVFKKELGKSPAHYLRGDR
jgi:AraC-like DNA-binding protein